MTLRDSWPAFTLMVFAVASGQIGHRQAEADDRDRGRPLIFERSITWAAGLALLRRFWWAVPMIGLLAALHFTRETLADRTATLTAERSAWTAEIAKADTLRADMEQRFASQQSAALTTFADRLANRQPIIL